ncbi:MAG: Smr/MutS family protein [Micavibrio sp.]
MSKNKDDAGKPPKRTLSGEERSLWNFVTRSIRPLTGQLKDAPPEPPEKPPVNPPVEIAVKPDRRPWAGGIPEFRLKDPAAAAKNETGGIDRRTLEKLRRGQLPLDGVLDLHGLRQGEAQERLTRFLTDGYHAGRRCVLVISGKGSRNGEAGVLRRMVPHWLDMPPLFPIILSHCPAKQKDGGDGAFYVLLRRKRL